MGAEGGFLWAMRALALGGKAEIRVREWITLEITTVLRVPLTDVEGAHGGVGKSV